jgi:hypothetical protein
MDAAQVDSFVPVGTVDKVETVKKINKNCILMYHMGAGDGFTMYAAVMHYQKIYDEVNIFCLHRYRHTFAQLYEPYANVKVNFVDDVVFPHTNFITNLILQTYKPPQSYLKPFDLFLCGNYHSLFEGSNGFWERFYDHLQLPYTMRYDYTQINRNKEREMKLYNDVVSRLGEKYIFLHDHRNHNDNSHFYIRPNIYVESELPVFHPNFNYHTNSEDKYHHLWTPDLISDNLLDYCTLIENATEIHIRDSAFSCLAPYLDLKNVKKKCVYSNYDLVHYHNSYAHDWNIIDDYK